MFIPFYSYSTNINNITFVLSNVFVMLFLLCDFCEDQNLLGRGRGFRRYLFLVLLFCGVSLYYNLTVNECYPATFNRVISFMIVLGCLNKKDEQIWEDKNLYNVITNIMCAAFLFSLFLYFFLSLDAVYLQNFGIGLRYIGLFADGRLTYVFVHKSGYGLILVLFLMLVLWKQDISFRKSKIVLCCFTILVTNSVISYGAMSLCIIEYLASKKARNRKQLTFKLMAEFVVLIIVLLFYIFIGDSRDISYAGGRLFIWQAGIEAIKMYPLGIGKDFYTKTFFALNGIYYNNFHNIFINDMVHYSVIVGIVYSAMVVIFPVYAIVKSKGKMSFVIRFIAILLIISMDSALHDSILPLYMLLSCIIFKKIPEVDEGWA